MFNIFKRKKQIKFYDFDGNEIEYIEYIEEEQSLVVDRGNGQEKIPAHNFNKVEE